MEEEARKRTQPSPCTSDSSGANNMSTLDMESHSDKTHLESMQRLREVFARSPPGTVAAGSLQMPSCSDGR